MLTRRLAANNLSGPCRRYLSNEPKRAAKRFIQTIPTTSKTSSSFYSGLNYSIGSNVDSSEKGNTGSKWARHSLSFPSSELPSEQKLQEQQKPSAPVRRSRTSRFSNRSLKEADTKSEGAAVPTASTSSDTTSSASAIQAPEPALPKITTNEIKASASSTDTSKTAKKPRRTLRPRKALITLSASAVEHLQGLLQQPEPQLIRIGVQNRGCSGLTYNLEYVTEPGKFDEKIEQDGVTVYIDSKALFSIVGSEMDWLDDKLSSRFIFKNPNSKGTCGCGESFMV